MGIHLGGRLSKCVVVLVAAAAIVAVAVAEERTWSDASGKFKLDAELVEVKDGKAVLLSSEGKTVTVPIKRLSKADLAFIQAQEKQEKSKADPAQAAPIRRSPTLRIASMATFAAQNERPRNKC